MTGFSVGRGVGDVVGGGFPREEKEDLAEGGKVGPAFVASEIGRPDSFRRRPGIG